MDIQDHYTLINDGELFDWQDAKPRTRGREDHLWFVRHGDGCDHEYGDFVDGKCECDETWDVELYHGQYVNCAGFFVSEEPCKPEHRDTVFTY